MSERAIFITALEKDDPAERAAFLDQACANDPPLRQRIERLLKAHEPADSFLEHRPPGWGRPSMNRRSPNGLVRSSAPTS
jgi:eukaryotic-like serine/threonine-protein kinase